jgi:polar amino acid transport system permease protein
MTWRWDILAGYGPLFAQGLWMTIQLTVISTGAGMVLGAAVGLVHTEQLFSNKSAWPVRLGLLLLQWSARAYVTFFRGTPLFVQILLVHFALMPLLVHPDGGWLIGGEAARVFRQEHGAFLSGSLALTLNAGAYISEIFRAGIQSIHRGQTAAALSLGMTPWQSMRYIVLPQAFRRMVPALVNESVALVKDTSLVSAIGLLELAMAARTVAGAYSRYWEPYLAISALYLVLTWVLSRLAKRLETPAHARGH